MGMLRPNGHIRKNSEFTMGHRVEMGKPEGNHVVQR